VVNSYLPMAEAHVSTLDLAFTSNEFFDHTGKPERIVETLRKIDKQPAFPSGLLSGLPLPSRKGIKSRPP